MKDILLIAAVVGWIASNIMYVRAMKPWKTIQVLSVAFIIAMLNMTEGNVLDSIIMTPLLVFSSVMLVHTAINAIIRARMEERAN